LGGRPLAALNLLICSIFSSADKSGIFLKAFSNMLLALSQFGSDFDSATTAAILVGSTMLLAATTNMDLVKSQ
jgi:hypothetical protein